MSGAGQDAAREARSTTAMVGSLAQKSERARSRRVGYPKVRVLRHPFSRTKWLDLDDVIHVFAEYDRREVLDWLRELRDA